MIELIVSFCLTQDFLLLKQQIVFNVRSTQILRKTFVGRRAHRKRLW